jgi:phosphate transport system protein
MSRIRFQQGLDELKHKLLVMAGLSEQALQLAIRGYRERDQQFCQQVFEREREINNIERDIDHLALDLLAMQQPMAVDLRFIVAVIKINTDLERVGDQAVNIAERVQELIDRPPIDLPVDLPEMAELAAKMIRSALDAFIRADPQLAEQVCIMDDDVDRMNGEAQLVLGRVIQANPQTARVCIDAIIISRNLERIADHATNIAEDVIFWTSGKDVRHGVHAASHRHDA